MRIINGQLLKEMIISGSNNLYNYYPDIDALNVFPVPDGDTGTNMNLTMSSGAKTIMNRQDDDCYSIAKAFSKGLLMGARGNSGVITSQIFRGFADALEGKSEIDALALADAFENGAKVAYKAVIKPVEGTILTVIRETSQKLAKSVTAKMTIEQAFKLIILEGNASLERTPNLLPVLKEVGVVDSGGAGLMKILEGMQSALLNKMVERLEDVVETEGSSMQTSLESEEAYGYCTEFILRLEESENKKKFDQKRFTTVLNAKGNSLVVVSDYDVVKVHIHTLRPGEVFNYAQQFGEFVKLKCENMTEQHNEILFQESLKENSKKSVKESQKDYALIVTSSGKGIDKLFNEIGITNIVNGGQTMNSSTSDFLDAIEKANAKVCYLFPNNGNIILAASQAKEILEGKVKVYVIPTKTIMQGVVSAMNFNPDLKEDENFEVMNEAISSVRSGAVTFAIKDTEIEGVKVKKNEFMAIVESKNIISSHKSKFIALKSLLKRLIDDNSAICTILCGEDIKDREMKNLAKELEEEYPLIDVDIRKGDQPVYSFLVGIE
ncbi:MAG TPA: DAK2 domain-containing protein [Candidatus Onthovivens sp.]|nr:DAK2 domain-containing protein [Candidatus Onthovivens sp.]